MVIVWGSRMCGKVDAVPGICHVATNFGHLYYIPLIPTQSLLVFGEDENGIYGLKIPFSFKSILVAWMRTALWAVLIFAIGATLIVSFDAPGRNPIWPPIAISLSILALLILSYRVGFLTRASIERTTQFAEMEEMPENIRRALIEEIKKMHIVRGDVAPDHEAD